MYKPERTCKVCKETKRNIHFYRTRGNKCIGCCIIENHATTHNIDNMTEAKDNLIIKYTDKLIQLNKEANIYKYKLQEITGHIPNQTE